MAFRRYGGMNYAATNNIVRNHYANSDNFTSSNRIGLSSNTITNGSQANSNIVFQSNIDLSGNSIFNNSIASKNVAGIYLLNQNLGVTSPYFFYPIYSSINDYHYYCYNDPSKTLPSNESIIGIYNNVTISVANMDNAYLITPGYGLKVYNQPDLKGDIILDVHNHTDSPIVVAPIQPLTGNSCEIYFIF